AEGGRAERGAGSDPDPEQAYAGHDAASFREQLAVSPAITADLAAPRHPRFELIARRPRSDPRLSPQGQASIHHPQVLIASNSQ
ncbi:hypothetical protein, partial [Bradyrhizobium ivorense]|uniref:hypothetical protein n=1 Tax=Bradyrhizobium ivorense TaxID=2511166 RepID=UPI001E46DA1A